MTWKMSKVNDICLVTDYVANGSFKTLSDNVKYLNDDGYAILVRLTDFTKGWNGNYKYVDEHAYNFLAKTKLVPGDLLISNVGEPGKTFLVPDLGMPMTLGPNSILVRPNSNFTSTKFLKYFLDSCYGKNLINSIVSKATHSKFNKTSFRNLEIPLPPLEEQERIVEKLDAAFAEIETAIEEIVKARKSVIRLHNATLINELNDDSYDWQFKELGTIADNLDSTRMPITKSKRIQGSVPYYGASGIVDYVEGHLFDEDLLLISEDGANLLMRTYPIAFSVSGKTWVNNHAHVLRFSDKEIQRWVERYLNTIDLSKYISGMAQPKLNQKKLNSIPIPLPNKPKFLELLEIIEVLKVKSDDLNEIYSEKEAQLLKLKSAFLAQELQPPQGEAA